MQEKHWLCAVLDGIGLTSLIGSVLALGGARWLTGALSETFFYQTFYLCLALAVSLIMVARVAEICTVVARNPNPKRLRTQRSPVDVPETLQPVTESAQNKFQRAA